MQDTKVFSNSSLDIYNTTFGVINRQPKTSKTSKSSLINKKFAKRYTPETNPSYPEKHLPFYHSEKNAWGLPFLFNEAHSQAEYYISLIEDPLWKHVCSEILNTMGPFPVLNIWDSRLGSFSPQEKTITLGCQSEEIAQFIQQYAFVFLGILQEYFPTIKKLMIGLSPKENSFKNI